MAEIAFVAMKIGHHIIEEIDLTDEDVGVNGTVFLLSSVEKKIVGSSGKTIEYRHWHRGI